MAHSGNTGNAGATTSLQKICGFLGNLFGSPHHSDSFSSVQYSTGSSTIPFQPKKGTSTPIHSATQSNYRVERTRSFKRMNSNGGVEAATQSNYHEVTTRYLKGMASTDDVALIETRIVES